MNRQLWNTGWSFLELPLTEAAYALPAQGELRSVDLPHDWMIEETHGLYRDSIGWYRKHFSVTEKDCNRQLLVRFDGVYMDTTVYVNGVTAGEWKYGYSTFEIDLTPFLTVGENTLWVRVVYQSPNTRWYSGAGIYRDVWLITRDRMHIASDGIYLTERKQEDGSWIVEIETELEHTGEAVPERLTLRQCLLDGETTVASCEAVFSYPEEKQISQTLSVRSPRLWDIGQGNLYTVRTELLSDGVLRERQEQRIGFRTLELTADRGLLINGRQEKLHGVCEHHDFGCLGAAFYTAAMRRKLELLRRMGVNAVRSSHNMPDPKLMELADEMGFLIDSEAFDMWEKCKTPYDYGRFFPEWKERDVASWVRRDRNHASLLMWSIGNEIQDTLTERGVEVTAILRDCVRKHDPKHNAPVTIGSNFIKWEEPQQSAELLDAVGYNYSAYLYEEHHAKHPDWVIYGSETASVLASRSIYHFPREKSVLTDMDEHCSALGNTVTGWGAKSYEACIIDDRDTEYSLGQFLWVGFDHLGESTPYQTKNCYYGQIDMAGFPKDSFYIFQAEWTSCRTAPMVHVFPYWDFNEGQLIDVQACTNAPRVELFVNGISQGMRQIDHRHGTELVPCWKVPYHKGAICAVAYDENGTELAREERHSFGDTAVLRLTADRTELSADGADLAFLTIEAYDSDGYPVENARNRIQLTVTGAGRLIGLDNGDSTDFDEHKGRSRRLFGGKLLAVVAAKKEPGEIFVTAASEGMEPVTVTLRAAEVTGEEKTALRTGTAAAAENRNRVLYGGGSQGRPLAETLPAGFDPEREIPVRKIALSCTGERKIVMTEGRTKEEAGVLVTAELYPANATYRDLEWRVLTDTGIEVNCASLHGDGWQRLVLPEGDGQFRLRCSCRNGGSAESVQSTLEFSVTGMGCAAFDPYRPMCTGLCDDRTELAAEGVEHGINFLGGADSRDCYIGFGQVDFGKDGTDLVTISVFANTNDAVQLQLWEGRPYEQGSTLLSDVPYHKKSDWMVFKPMTFRLSKRLTGVTSFYLATKDSFQCKELVFEKQEKAFASLRLTDCDQVYGDAFRENHELGAIEGIGNNVSIAFEQMDFGTAGAGQICLTGRSPLAASTIQLRFRKEDATQIQAITVPGSEDYTEHILTIEPLYGVGTVDFLFMPGSCFDWKTVKFVKNV